MTAPDSPAAELGRGEIAENLQFPTSHPRSDLPATADRLFSWKVDLGAGLPTGDRAAVAIGAAFTLLVHRYCERDDVVVGRAGSGRGATEHLVPVRSRLAEDTSFDDLVNHLAAAYRDASGPHVPCPLAFRDFSDTGELRDLPSSAELLLDARIVDGTAELAFRYADSLFTAGFVARLAANLTTLLADACARPSAPVRDLTLLAADERRYLLETRTATACPYPRDASIADLVRAQADRTPDAPAVRCQDDELSYRELDEHANALARALAASGVRPGDRVGVSAARSARLVALLLAIHKAGCAYVPLDPAYPADRLLAIADTADLAAVVFDGEAPGWLAGLDAVPVPAATLWEKAATEARDDLDVRVDPDSPAHLIYTSGSTGQPKGVVIHHRNVVALLAWAWQTYTRDDVARVLFGTSLNFDLSVFELWTPLTMGGCVLVVDNVLALTERDDLDPTLINTVPSALNVLVRRDALPASATVLNVAGEPLPKELVNAAFACSSARRLYNLYGPSEDTTYSTYKCFDGPVTESPTIGVPIHNTVAYLLDARGALVPHGVAGELYLGGAGLSSGYSNDEERTAAVFVAAPDGIGAGTLYRTGDLARWTEDGELQFLGRKDNQVKIRGYRIELGEIEAVLREVDGLGDVAALAVRADEDTRLVCYCAGTVDSGRIGAHLRRRLPYYMQPAKIVVADRLPLLPNGKVDRKTLVATPVDWGVRGTTALSADEARVAEVWTDLLGITGMAAELDFFSVGGHSLLANLLAARLSDRFAVAVRVSEVYEYRTLAEQTALIRAKRELAPTAADADDVTARFAAAAACLRESARGHGVPGAAAAIYLDGESDTTYYGLDDVATGRERDALSRQRVTCLTKVLIAYVALMLVDQGRLALDEPLGRDHPELTRRRDRSVDITLRQLLSHTSGIDDSYEIWNDTDFPELTGYVESFERYGQVAEPGEIFAYSACGTSLVARLIEKVLGVPWRRAVNTMLLRPLGIADIAETLHAGDHYGDSVATGYTWSEAEQCYTEFRPAPPTMANDAADSFSVCFTLAETLTLAVFALDDGVTRDGQRLLSAELAEQMRTPQVDIPGHHFMHSWGLGWLMFDEGVFGFNSNGSGQHNFVQIFVEQRLVLVMLADAYPTFGLYEDLLHSVTGKGWLRSDRESDVDIDGCVGTYESDGYRLVVTPGEEHLRYRYFERVAQDEWSDADAGDLVLSGTGGFSSISAKNILRGSISPIWVGSSPAPSFMRLGQRVVRKVR